MASPPAAFHACLAEEGWTCTPEEMEGLDQIWHQHAQTAFCFYLHVSATSLPPPCHRMQVPQTSEAAFFSGFKVSCLTRPTLSSHPGMSRSHKLFQTQPGRSLTFSQDVGLRARIFFSTSSPSPNQTVPETAIQTFTGRSTSAKYR